jgi:hypothetical protein
MYLIAFIGVLILGGNWLPAINSKHNSSFSSFFIIHRYSDHMAAAAAPLWTPSEIFAPTILFPTMYLETYFQDIPLDNFYYG